MITYIIFTASKEYYCGKTSLNIEERLEQHKNEKYPHWFCSKLRKKFLKIWVIDGNYEDKIKKYGVKNFIYCAETIVSTPI